MSEYIYSAWLIHVADEVFGSHSAVAEMWPLAIVVLACASFVLVVRRKELPMVGTNRAPRSNPPCAPVDASHRCGHSQCRAFDRSARNGYCSHGTSACLELPSRCPEDDTEFFACDSSVSVVYSCSLEMPSGAIAGLVANPTLTHGNGRFEFSFMKSVLRSRWFKD